MSEKLESKTPVAAATAGSGSSLELFSFCPGCGGALYKATEHICPNRGLDRKWAIQMDMTIDEYIDEYNETVRREETDGVGTDICSQKRSRLGDPASLAPMHNKTPSHAQEA